MKETFVFSVKKNTRRVEVSNHWKYCVGSGQAKLAMRSDYARQLKFIHDELGICLLYTSPSTRDGLLSSMPSSE